MIKAGSEKRKPMEGIFTKEFYSKKRIIAFSLTLIGAVIIYSLLMSERLVNNYDGLWSGSFYAAGEWEVSGGRFVWPFLDRARAWLCQDPYMSLISLLAITVSMIIVDSLLGIEKVWQAVLVNLMFVANVVVCAFLSYRFESNTFTFSFFLAIFAVALIVYLKRPWNILAAGVSLMLSMGLHQACIGCTCVLIVAVLILELLRGKENRDIIRFLIDCALSAVVGGIIYFVLNRLFLSLYHTQMLDYGGNPAGYSILGTLKGFPQSILRTYDQFIQYFFKDQFFVTIYNRFHTMQIIIIIFIVITVFCMVLWIVRCRIKGILAAAAVFLLPMASSAVLFIVTDGVNKIHMTAPLALVIPVLFSLAIFTERFISKESIRRVMTIILIITAGVFTYWEVLQVCWDQSEMLEGAKSTSWMYNSTIEDLKDEEMLSKDYKYLYFGRPADNDYFMKTVFYQYANNYAKVGNFWLDGECAEHSWAGVARNYGGAGIAIADTEQYQNVSQDEELLSMIRSMPEFPEAGYIKRVGDLVIVKIADYEEGSDNGR